MYEESGMPGPGLEQELPPMPLLEEHPEIAMILARESDLSLPVGLFGEFAEVAEQEPVEAEMEPAADPAQEYGVIFAQVEAGERTDDELLHSIEGWNMQEDRLLDGEPSSGQSAFGLPNGVFSLQGLPGTTGAVVAGIGGIGAALASRQPNAPGQRPKPSVYWWYSIDPEGVAEGPVEEAQLRAMLANRQLPAEIYVWKEKMTEWISAAAAGLANRGGTTG